MKSPRFDLRAPTLQRIFSPSNLEKAWKEKVRVSMRDQFLNDGIEHFDFHTSYRLECKKLSALILSGSYVPQRAQRILVEKSKGLCRQLVIPSAQDALILQCLSDNLYAQIKNKAPTQNSYFEPKKHRFNTTRSDYGTFAAWLNFQRSLFSFTKTRPYIVVTDIANYYDTISYAHLRNVISSMTDAEECVLDMLIYILSDLLWQPDYMPRIEVGLPQINLDAPRLLAHCFLYELDAFIASDPNRDFVRYMDDINVGVDSIAEAKQVLKSIDLVLQTKQVRLNSGKTLILTSADASKHFRVIDNARLDMLRDRVARKAKSSLSLERERRAVEGRLKRGLKERAFDTGSGEKILKRIFNLAAKTGAFISPKTLEQIIRLRPSLRETAFSFIRSKSLTRARARALASCIKSGLLIDDAAIVELSNHLVETNVRHTERCRREIAEIIDCMTGDSYYTFYCRLWLQSKYDSTRAILDTIRRRNGLWIPHDRLGRLVGSLFPIFIKTSEAESYRSLLIESRNPGAREAYKFHSRLIREVELFDSMYDALRNPNPSRGTKITHSKFLCLLSALINENASPSKRAKLVKNNEAVFEDSYYRSIGRRLRII